MSGEPLCIDVVFAVPDRQELVTVLVDEGATVADAIDRSLIQAAFPEWNLDDCAVGIWGRPVVRGQMLQQGDRVEIYRPLQIDPRDARRRLAAEGRSMGKAAEDGDAAGTEESLRKP